MRWRWGQIYTEKNYRTAMSDSDCFNMFVEAVMQRLAVIGVWTWLGSYRTDFPLGTFIPNGSGGPTTQYQYGKFNPFTVFGRDWYKGFNNINMRLSEGWPILQNLVMSMRPYFVRCRNESGIINNFNGSWIVPGWNSQMNYSEKEPNQDDPAVTWSRQKIETPSDGWHRKYHRTIRTLKSPGREGWVARLDPTPPTSGEVDNDATNLWGMRNWIFEFDEGKWKYAPHKLDVDLIDRHGAIAKCDRIGPWILNDLKQAIDDLVWTYAASNYGQARPVAPVTLSLGRSIHLFGYDKINTSSSQSLNGVTNTHNGIVPNPALPANFSQTDYPNWTIRDEYFENRHWPGIYSAIPYNIGFVATNFGTINIETPGDPTGTYGSYPYPSNLSLSGSWNQGIDWFNPTKYLQYSEGIPRTIDYYTAASNFAPLSFLTSRTAASWSDIDYGGPGVAGVIKWDFKYTRNKNTATWKGFPDAFRWSDRP